MSPPAFDYRDPADRLRAVLETHRPIAPGVLDVLIEQESRRTSSAARDRSLELLGSGDASVVVTGQQAGLFTGPLYTLYKTAAAITAAKALTEESGRPVVPVFWLQTEDHDWPEIDHCYVPPIDGEPLKIAVDDVWSDRLDGDRVSVFQRPLGTSIAAALDAIGEVLGTLPGAGEVMELLRAHYRPNTTPGAALGQVMASLFAESGLVVLDAGDPALSTAAAPVHRVAVEQADAIAQALLARNAELEAGGQAAPVHVRPGAPLSFYHPDGADGPRYRIEPSEVADRWRLCTGASDVEAPDAYVTKAEVLQALDDTPERFSSSALLRPLLQDAWLPTVAYFGGPGELRYLQQVRPLYPIFELAEPMIVPRARFRIVDRGTRRKMSALGLSGDEDLTAPRPELLAVVGGVASGDKADPAGLGARWTATVESMFEAFEREADGLDRGLSKAATRVRDNVLGQLEKLVDKYARALAKRDEVTLQRLDHVVAMLAPLGAPQERIYGWPWFAARFGVKQLTEAILDQCVAFDGTLRVIDPEAAREHR